MRDLQEYIQFSGPAAECDYVALQRQALQELQHLSVDVVGPVQMRIESDRQAAEAEAYDRFQQDKQEIDLYRQSQTQDAARRLQTYANTIKEDLDQQAQAVESQVHKKRQKINYSAAEQQSRNQNQREEALLEADFMAEGNVEKIRKAAREAKDWLAEAQRNHQVLRERLALDLQRYRQLAPVWPDQDLPTSREIEKDEQAYTEQGEMAEQALARLDHTWSVQLMVGLRPVAWGLGIVLMLATLGVMQASSMSENISPLIVGIVGAGIGGLLVTVLLLVLRRCGRVQSTRLTAEFQNAWLNSQAAAKQHYAQALSALEQEIQRLDAQKKAERHAIEETFTTKETEILQVQEKALQILEQARQTSIKKLLRERAQRLREVQEEHDNRRRLLNEQYQKDLNEIQQRRDRQLSEMQATYETDRQQLEARWDQGIACVNQLLISTEVMCQRIGPAWSESAAVPLPSGEKPLVRMGSLRLDMNPIAEAVRQRAGDRWSAATIDVPALLSFPERCSLLLHAGREGRMAALDALRAVMVRLFTTLPAGVARFTIIDPIGLGESFAGFMHAGDYLESLVGGRIWTEAAHIQQQLEDLTSHMENVIQKYLRNEFETIEDYNEQAGELAEPYRFLVIADFPTNFTEEAARRLTSILQSGPRCGVHTLIVLNEGQELPAGMVVEDLTTRSVYLKYEADHFVWQDAVMRSFSLILDTPPDETTLTEIMHRVGKAGAASARVEVPFESIAPNDEQIWSADSRRELRVALGRTGATRLQYMSLGQGMAQHMLIAGKTGSGKSTLLHAMITNLALWYGPDEVTLYLIDFKKGVEFKCYVTHHLPHAQAVAIESDREFGLSILQRLDAEMTRRGELFRQAGVQDIAGYRDKTDECLPRTLLMVDEFQVFFAEDDKLAQDTSVLLEQLVRQGRAFGIHVILGSQTLGGAFGLARSTMGQMAVRIAMQCSEADSQLILDDDNVAARLLTRPGEALYNDAGGQVVGNSPFQTAWLSDSTRDAYLQQIAMRVQNEARPLDQLIVFEGSEAADIRANRLLAAVLVQSDNHVSQPATFWLGEPVAIKDPTSVTFKRQSGANLMMVGQRDEVALHLFASTLIGLAASQLHHRTRFVILDGRPGDDAEPGLLTRVSKVLPHDCRLVAWREVPEIMSELAGEVSKRVQGNQSDSDSVFLLVYGLQRYRMLRRSEDSFSLNLDGDGTPQPDAQFADVLRDGPTVGVHTVVWADTLATIERTLDRQTAREFDHRVLFQMSAADSSNLIDSTAANLLGFHRALLYNEEQGGIEKFRPYAAPAEEWLRYFQEQLKGS